MSVQCSSHQRRSKLFNNAEWNGIDFVEVEKDQKSLCLHFFGNVPKNVFVRNVKVSGGRRITDVRVIEIRHESAHDSDLDDCLHVTFDKPGDFSTYRICIIDDDGNPFAGMDPRYACINFSFKVDCHSEIDCNVSADCIPDVYEEPDINYLAKDYASFRQLIYDRMSLTMPDWRERHAPDLGVTLVEILAYAADHLSYYQDAVATEAYLETARLRTSIRRHLRLIDYQLGEGLNARVLVTIWVSTDISIPSTDHFYFTTALDGLLPSNGNTVNSTDLLNVPSTSFEIFEPDKLNHPGPIDLRAAHSRIEIYTWGDEECCLEKGATRATLVDNGPRNHDGVTRTLQFAVGDIIIFEEVLGTKTGAEADANPDHRHPVRLTRCTPSEDQLLGQVVLEVEWDTADALPFAFCLSSRRTTPDCDIIRNITVVRGNIVVCSHGQTQIEELAPVEGSVVFAECACEGSVVESEVVSDSFEPMLKKGPLAFSDDIPRTGPAAALFLRNTQSAVPQLGLFARSTQSAWTARSTLLGENAEAEVFVAECDDDGKAKLRFGNNVNGQKPTTGEIFEAKYRVADTKRGNVGRDAINTIVFRNLAVNGSILAPRNPMSARGGDAPESVDEARMVAPGLLQSNRQRAITAADYAELAARNAKLQGAAAELRWTGSWREVRVAIDPLHTNELPPALVEVVEGEISKFRRMGHDLSVVAAKYVPLNFEIRVCVLPHFARSDVLRALQAAFSSTAVGGYFEPDQLVFGGGVRVSRIIALAQGLEGVRMVEVTKLDRMGGTSSAALDTGILPMSALEIAQLDNDRDFPENGKYKIVLGGGR